MGAVKVAVQLMPFDKDRKMSKKKTLRLIERKAPVTFSKEELDAENLDSREIISRGLAKYEEERKLGLPIVKLERTMFYTPEH
jgi:hypothetical protein